MAGCAIALLGVYRGYVAERGRIKLFWYTVMHIGALIGFMAKSGPGWIVPGLALIVLIVWERRGRELQCWELWAGILVQFVAIGAWVAAVLGKPGGADNLHVLFWNNLAGRFADLHAAGALDYAASHRNWPGKYWLEFPYHVFPWTLLVIAASYRAWSTARMPGPAGTPWRFAVSACLPFVVLLSFAVTARGIYIAPALLGFAILAGLWAGELSTTPLRFAALAIRITRYAVAGLALLMLAGISLMAAVARDASGAWRLIIAASAIAVISALAMRRSAVAQQQHRYHGSLGWDYVTFAASISIGGSMLLPLIDEWQDLQPLARTINLVTAGHALALIQPDETTIAMLDHQLRTPFTIIDGVGADPTEATKKWLNAHAAGSLVLILLPGHANGRLGTLLQHLHLGRHSADDGLLSILEQDNIAHAVARYQLPEGRRYALVEANAGAASG